MKVIAPSQQDLEWTSSAHKFYHSMRSMFHDITQLQPPIPEKVNTMMALRRSMIAAASRSLIILFAARFATFSARFASFCFAWLRAMRSRFLARRRSMMVTSASIVARWMELVMGCFLGWGRSDGMLCVVVGEGAQVFPHKSPYTKCYT